jgi:flagellar P-ring protein precursor FlgI
MFSAQSLTNLLQRMGLTISPDLIQVKNTAAVMVTGTLPPFAQPGSSIDVTVAAIGDCSSLQGGMLLMTSLRAVNGAVYAVAQGPVVMGGFVAGTSGTKETLNHPTVGRVPNGALVERDAPSVLSAANLHLQLRDADFMTAARIAAAVNRQFPGSDIAHADNSGLVSVKIPESYRNRTTEFVAELQGLSVEVDRAAKVVVNERTGTVVMGKDVRIAPVAIMQGNLNVEIQTNLAVSQPEGFSQGKTAVVPQVGVGVKEERTRNLVLKEGATVEELVRGLNAIGSTSRDIIAILQALRSAGALQAELEVI